ncbi:MAG: hypothetical protein HOV79_26980 [Hamadaea sp.]|nr:hypothetical protein [Hamadaea sp.]
MKRVGLWGAIPAALVAGAAFMALQTWSSPRGEDEDPVGYTIGQVVMSGPWMLAAAILWYAWWRWAGVRLSGVDAPERLLAAAVATLPAERRDWGTAMTAELAEVSGAHERWRFATGCARTALFPPRGNRLAAVLAALAVGALAVGAGYAVGAALPSMLLFAVVFVSLAGAVAVLGVARSWRVRRPGHSPAVIVVGLLGAAVCVAVTAYDLSADRTAVLGTAQAVWLAILLTAALWLTVAPPRAMTTNRMARRVGLGAGVVLAVLLFVVARFSAEGGIIFAPVTATVTVVFGVAAYVAATTQSFAAGLQATVWTVTTSALLSFGVWVFEAMRWFDAHGTSLLDGDRGSAAGHIHEGVIWILIAGPLLALPFGVIGAAIGGVGTYNLRADILGAVARSTDRPA